MGVAYLDANGFDEPYKNKAVVDIRLCPVLPPGDLLSIRPVSIAFAWPIMGRHDVHNIMHCYQRRIEPRPQLTHMKIM